MSDWESMAEEIERRTDRVLSELDERWGDHERREPLQYGPSPVDPDGPPASVAEQLETMAGIASVYVFYTDERRETVLVYNPGGGWEPPGGRIEPDQTPEETARAEAREETGAEIELTELVYTRRVEYTWASGHSVALPLAQFAGHRTDGRLQVEREGNTHPAVSRAHPGLSRGTGLFDAETLPELRRDTERVASLLNEPPEWNPDGDHSSV
ncbi:NUDIX hydrolase [Halobaculum sp. MBLA0147]|uniref:NUDIX hydrolase n=1 Tax=Halobaculum sp. MBLA0147 TaxID=3079934 RepID=UPI0035232353